MSRWVARFAVGCLFVSPLLAADGPPREAAVATLDTITVTGSYIRRTDTESPSPVDVISAEDIEKSGRTNIADVLHALSSTTVAR